MKIQIENLNNVKDRYKEIQRNRYFHLSLTLATASIFIVFAIKPTVTQAIQSYNNLQELKQLEKTLAEKKDKLDQAKSLINQNQEKIELLEKAIPKDADESIFLANLNEAAYRNQVILDNIQFNFEDKKNEGFQQLKFSASFDATYPSFQQFIENLNRFLRLVEINEVNIQENQTLKGKRIKGTISGVIFYR